jgi:hypothetical protein
MIGKLNSFYDKLNLLWHSQRVSKWISNIVLLFFVGGVIVTFTPFNSSHNGGHLFFSIELAFNVLLIFEVLRLLFVFTKSVASAVGKQFEIISLILLRDSFKEIGYLPIETGKQSDILTSLLPMVADALGAMVIFLLIGFFYSAQRHIKITATDEEQVSFVNMKKLLALVLFIIFVFLGCQDLLRLWQTGEFESSVNIFYTVLVVTDIFILLYSLRYSSRYNNLFRYSSYALATVILRFSLSAPKYVNVMMGIGAGVFVLLVTYAYNYLSKEELNRRKQITT